MSGIPVYTQSPINAAKASGSTPQTAVPLPVPSTSAPASTSASTTAMPSSSSYPPAQPGAPAAPAPTGAAQRYVPDQPTPTQPTPTTKTSSEPPLPQPGSFPTPTHSMRDNLPPPPRRNPGESYIPPQASLPQPYPPQMSIPPPSAASRAQPPSSSTSTTNAPSSSYPVPLPVDDHSVPRRSLEHPPGYVQNPDASDFTAQQRAAQEAQESSFSGFGSSPKESTTAAFGVDAEGVWHTAKKWAQTAGEKLSETEAEIWKRVNGEK